MAYTNEVKYDLLDVPVGPVVTPECASQMAVSARRLLGADIVAAVTGVGGPDETEGQTPGTVFLAVASGNGSESAVEHHHFEGSPEEVVTATVHRALSALVRQLEETA